LPNPSAKSPPPADKVIAVTLGDPLGIGPEVVAKSLDACSGEVSLLVVGDRRHFPAPGLRILRDAGEIGRGERALLEVEGDGDPSFLWVRTAAELARAGRAQALVTGPVSKERWLAAGAPYRGHTDFFAAGAAEPPIMFFWSPGLKVALFTHHLPLREMFPCLERGAIVAFVRRLDRELRRLFGREFTYLFSGLNPHAGESGRLGSEELETILPAVGDLRNEVQVAGLFPPDVVFAKARSLKGAVVVAWSHDQGLIPFKLLHAGDGVQLTLGLPFVRTSPVHGTAFDIAGKGIAEPGSMRASLRLAESLLR